MKKKSLALVICSIAAASFTAPVTAQQNQSDNVKTLFDENGSFTRVSSDSETVSQKMISLNPRVDDVVWRKAVLRVIDLRENQNKPLYYPAEDIDSLGQKNLFSVIFKHVLDGTLKAYKSPTNPEQTFVPPFRKENEFKVNEFLEANNLNLYTSDYEKINYITPGVIKFYVQEVWYFDKSSSTFHNKIIALAPLYEEKYNTRSEMRTSAFFWVPYEKLRPYLQEEFVKMSGRNTAPLVNFDEFFLERQFVSYIIKDYDIQQKDIDKGIENPNTIRSEQQRVENEILNFELDLWNY